jgi:hypothetical protein
MLPVVTASGSMRPVIDLNLGSPEVDYGVRTRTEKRISLLIIGWLPPRRWTYVYCRSRWPRGIRYEVSFARSNVGIVGSNPAQGIGVNYLSPARTLGSWVGILLKAWMSACVFILCFVLSCV